MELVLKVVAIAIVCALLTAILKRSLAESAFLVMLASVVVIIMVGGSAIRKLISDLYEVSDYGGISHELLKPMFKTLGISFMSKLGCDVCRDGGVSGVATCVEFIGGIAALLVSMPMMMNLLKQISP